MPFELTGGRIERYHRRGLKIVAPAHRRCNRGTDFPSASTRRRASGIVRAGQPSRATAVLDRPPDPRLGPGLAASGNRSRSARRARPWTPYGIQKTAHAFVSADTPAITRSSTTSGALV